ncbi:OsmC family protein [Streptomyces sp. NPDC054796]
MRNGLNITGVSESVHEYRDHPEEAIADFAVSTPLTTATADGGLVESRTLALRDGTYRIARDFTLRHRCFPSSAEGAPTPYESALAAVAACVLTTKVNGYTSRGVSLGSLRVTARALLPLAADGSGGPALGTPLRELSWTCDVDCDAPGELVRSVNELVTAFSPNHQVAVAAVPIEASVTVRGPDGNTDTHPVTWTPAPPPTPEPAAEPGPAPQGGAGVCVLEADVVWEYGSESAYTTTLTRDGELRAAGPLTVDQAKQMLGIDKGPNSQEILLAALCAELSGPLREEAAARGIPLDGARLTASGRLDTRGMLNVVREVPSGFHDLRLGLHAERADGTGCTGGTEGERSGPDLAALLATALSRAVLPATLLAPLTVTVGLRRATVEETSFVSTLEKTEAIRDEVTRRQQLDAGTTGTTGTDEADAAAGAV